MAETGRAGIAVSGHGLDAIAATIAGRHDNE